MFTSERVQRCLTISHVHSKIIHVVAAAGVTLKLLSKEENESTFLSQYDPFLFLRSSLKPCFPTLLLWHLGQVHKLRMIKLKQAQDCILKP